MVFSLCISGGEGREEEGRGGRKKFNKLNVTLNSANNMQMTSTQQQTEYITKITIKIPEEKSWKIQLMAHLFQGIRYISCLKKKSYNNS